MKWKEALTLAHSNGAVRMSFGCNMGESEDDGHYEGKEDIIGRMTLLKNQATPCIVFPDGNTITEAQCLHNVSIRKAHNYQFDDDDVAFGEEWCCFTILEGI